MHGRPCPTSRWKMSVPLTCSNGIRLRTNPWNVQPNTIQTRARRHVEGLPVVIAPREVGRELGRLDRAEMLRRRRDDPDAARAGHVEIALLVDLHAVERLVAGLAGHVEEHFAVRERPVRL